LAKAIIPVPFNMPPEIALTTLAPMGGENNSTACFRDAQDYHSFLNFSGPATYSPGSLFPVDFHPLPPVHPCQYSVVFV
jgi:hypothetical protein